MDPEPDIPTFPFLLRIHRVIVIVLRIHRVIAVVVSGRWFPFHGRQPRVEEFRSRRIRRDHKLEVERSPCPALERKGPSPSISRQALGMGVVGVLAAGEAADGSRR